MRSFLKLLRSYFADDTDPYVEANDYPPSPESWIGEASSGMEPGPGAGVPYE